MPEHPNYPRLSPYLVCDTAEAAIDFYTNQFGAKERIRLVMPDGKIGHAELAIGDAVIMLSDPFPDSHGVSPKELGGSPIALSLYVDDVDATFANIKAAGGTVIRDVDNQFYGDRSGRILDPFGHHWNLSTRQETLSHDDVARRFADLMSRT